ncbi:MAG: hypothetical protein IMW94_10410 [Thermoanaerobacter sp.]|nr:hypothetical protein [Thermoanaerobacter sp.]
MTSYYLRNKEKILEQAKEYYRKNRDKILERQRNYYQANKEKILQRQKAYRKKHAEKYAELYRKYRLKNIEKYRQYQRQYDRKRVKQKRELRRKMVIDYSTKMLWGVRKQPYPLNNECQACGSTHRLLNYHHVDDNNTEIGVWLCCYCHMRYHQHKKGTYKFALADKIDSMLDDIRSALKNKQQSS